MRKIKGLRWYMIALVTLGTVLGYLTRNTVAAAAPTLMEELHISTLTNGHSLIQTINIRVENPNLNNMAIQDVPILNSDKIICSRLKREETLMVPSPGTVIQLGDLLHLVGQP